MTIQRIHTKSMKIHEKITLSRGNPSNHPPDLVYFWSILTKSIKIHENHVSRGIPSNPKIRSVVENHQNPSFSWTWRIFQWGSSKSISIFEVYTISSTQSVYCFEAATLPAHCAKTPILGNRSHRGLVRRSVCLICVTRLRTFFFRTGAFVKDRVNVLRERTRIRAHERS